jgi:peptidoglycan/xylan/chitin deacetylase (PgdA/CDA1 family)
MRAHALMYHDVVDPDGPPSGFQGSGPAVYAVTPERFHRHLQLIERATAGPPQGIDALAGRPATAPPWMLTFDDGGSSALAVGEELRRRSWPGHFFVATDLVGQPGFLDWDELRELARMGHLIGSHSCSHPDRMAACPWEQLLEEWSRSVAELSERLGRAASIASVPGGLYSRQVGRAAALAGITSLFISLPSRRVRSVDGCLVIGRYAIRRDTPAEHAAAAAAGQPIAWARQRVPWALRGAAKRLVGRHYERVRRALLARS